MLGTLPAVERLRVGFAVLPERLNAEQAAHGALGLAHHLVGLPGPSERVGGGLAGLVGADLAVPGAEGRTDGGGGQFELGGAVGLEGRDLGDGGFVAALLFVFCGWGWEGAAEFSGEVDEGAVEKGVGGWGGRVHGGGYSVSLGDFSRVSAVFWVGGFGAI